MIAKIPTDNLSIRLAASGLEWENWPTTTDGPRPAAPTAGSPRGLARRYEGAPN